MAARKIKFMTCEDVQRIEGIIADYMEGVSDDIERHVFITRNQLSRYLASELSGPKKRIKRIYKIAKDERIGRQVLDDINVHLHFYISNVEDRLDFGFQITEESFIDVILKIVLYSKTIVDDTAKEIECFANLNRWSFSKEFIYELAETFFVENATSYVLQEGQLVSSLPDDHFAEWIFENVRMR